MPAYTAAVRALRFALSLLLAALSSACLVVSLQPVYEPDAIVFDPALLGTWVGEEDKFSLTFERAEWHSYHLLMEEDGDKPVRLSARLTRIGAHLFLDVAPLDGTDIPPLLLPVHGAYRVSLEGNTLGLADLEYDVLEARVREGKAGLPVVVDARKNLVITARTPDLRLWLEAHAEDEALFGAPVRFTRKSVEGM